MIRNVSPIWQDDACWGSTSHQTSRATLEQLNGCPSNTSGKDVPDGKPFRDPDQLRRRPEQLELDGDGRATAPAGHVPSSATGRVSRVVG
jgi:hypothetical protein